MKQLVMFLTIFFYSIIANSQSIIGAWERIYISENGEEVKSVAIFTDEYQVVTTFNAKSGKFISTKGGSWKLEGMKLTEIIEFNTEDSEKVGTVTSYTIAVTDVSFKIIDAAISYNLIDAGSPGVLQGAWLMSGRKKEGEILLNDTNRPRKTMKILSGSRFQWIAYNTETKQFMGTGGGTYSTIDGKYTENIQFFSRDDSKVGNSLQFNYELIDGKWHHSGLSSKGDPIYEIWSVRK